MTVFLICILLALTDMACVGVIVYRYSKDLDEGQFLANAPLDQIMRAARHANSAMLMFCMATVSMACWVGGLIK